MTYVNPYRANNLLDLNFDAIAAALNAGGGSGIQFNNWQAGGAALPAPNGSINVYDQNGGGAATSTFGDPAAGTDDGKLAVITFQNGAGSTITTTNFDLTENGTAVTNAAAFLVAANGQWKLVSAQGLTVV